MATYRGTLVVSVEHNPKDDTYSLVGSSGELIAELKRHEYLSIPQLRSMRLSNGRHRGAAAQNNRRAGGVAGQSWRDLADSILYSGIAGPGSYTSAIAKSPGPGITATQIAQQMQAMQALVSQRYISPAAMAHLLGEIHEKPPLKRDGIVAGEIVGYRCWRVEKGLLRSVYQKDVWRPGEVLEGRELGDWDSRGIHAWKDAGSKQYHDYIRGYLNSEDDVFSSAHLYFVGGGRQPEVRDRRPAMVTGTVFLWGDVVEHERGWRAEFARVRSLDWLYPDASMMGREQQALDDLRRRYTISRPQQTSEAK